MDGFHDKAHAQKTKKNLMVGFPVSVSLHRSHARTALESLRVLAVLAPLARPENRSESTGRIYRARPRCDAA